MHTIMVGWCPSGTPQDFVACTKPHLVFLVAAIAEGRNQTAIAKLMLPWQQKIPMPLLLAVLQPLLGCRPAGALDRWTAAC